ncbi:hypothetical protein ACPWT1_06770 [Ramlibacter sp. MMS24-I3-19]|uniref:hypothetical protein n=1 Tax=Ramlibacter sp. MMS24-I3-19 TaxID=3416606 RepID=UPI003CFE006E
MSPCLRRLVVPAFAATAALVPPALVLAQDAATLPPVNVTGTQLRDPVEKSYRRMLRGMDLFERERAALAPGSSLRFRVLQRKPGVRLDNLELAIVGRGIDIPIDVAPDRTFVLPRDAKAEATDAVVTPNRKALTMTWRADVRTPGLPPDARRLGDLRLECRVGLEAGLVSNSPSWIVRLYDALDTTPAYCSRKNNEYLFFADRPLFGVTLVAGTRRESLPVGRLWAGATDDPGLRQDLPFCDCEMLVDRTYFVPLADASWPHDTLVLFDFMDDGHAAR